MFPRAKASVTALVFAVLTVWTLLALPGRAGAADYIIQQDDVLSIRVAGEQDLSHNYSVDEKGDISVDKVGKLRMAGLTAKDAKEKLTTELQKYLKLVEVTLDVVGEVGNRVLVYGEVSKPGSTKIRTGDKLLDILAVAGPTTANADTKRVSVSRKGSNKVETVDLDQALVKPEFNLPIDPGDTITIPSKVSTSVRVDGEVSRPGPISLESISTAYTAIMQAGPNEKADWTRIAIRKKDSDIPLIVDLSKVRTGQLKDDLAVAAGDRITVMSKFAGTARVNGEVKSPGEKDLLGPVQLRDFILSQGGGFTEQADQLRVQVLRQGKPTMLVDLDAVAKGIKRADDPELSVHPGDIVYVPRGLAMVRGEVKTPGEFPLGSISNVWDFIAMKAGGFTDHADKAKVQLMRDGGKIKKSLDLQQIVDGKRAYDDPELAILPGDVISVPSDEGQRFAIVGAVKKAGKYPYKEGMRLLDALAMAESFSEKVDKKLVIAPANRLGPNAELKPDPKAKGKKKNDPAAYGLVVVDIKKLLKGDPSQNVAVNAGDQILVPEKEPRQPNGQGRGGLLQSILGLGRMLIFPYGGGYGYY